MFKFIFSATLVLLGLAAFGAALFGRGKRSGLGLALLALILFGGAAAIY